MKNKLLLSVAVILLPVFVVAGSTVYAQEGIPPRRGPTPPRSLGSALRALLRARLR
jgi:hypothetical protein